MIVGRRGFSLVELLVVLGVMALLVTLTMPVAELSLQREKERELKRALWEIRDALSAFEEAAQQQAIGLPPGAPPVPATLKELTLPYVDQRPQSQGQVLRFLRQVPRDPFAPAEVPAEQTWLIRGYYSEASDPKPLGGVYDVMSSSERVGLNGVPLRQW